ncbi:MAG: GNAT family N-acetyltransferase [Oscillospiraceae bacterium]|nr:GNAT family N-acetyltransferase [Oscillospiraceae bacterium]
MKLRKLQLKDAPFMLEWMHDSNVTEKLKTKFGTKTLDDCRAFIRESADCIKNLHLAIVDDEDEYMGTVSLKNLEADQAEFAITVRSCAMGRNYSRFGMREIIRKGFEELKLKRIYWCVSPLNERAIRFYDKNGYHRININELSIPAGQYSEQEMAWYIWYLEKPSV